MCKKETQKKQLHKYPDMRVQWLVGWLGLWHINPCSLFKAKSIFIQIKVSKAGNLS